MVVLNFHNFYFSGHFKVVCTSNYDLENLSLLHSGLHENLVNKMYTVKNATDLMQVVNFTGLMQFVN